MITCPQCKKTWPELVKQCGTCQTDLTLLTEFLTGVGTGLERAEALTKTGDLGPAVQAYLTVLDIDPGNRVARERLGQGATLFRYIRHQRRKKRKQPEKKPEVPISGPVSSLSEPPKPTLPPLVSAPIAPPLGALIVIGVVLLGLGAGLGFIGGSLWMGYAIHAGSVSLTPQSDQQ